MENSEEKQIISLGRTIVFVATTINFYFALRVRAATSGNRLEGHEYLSLYSDIFVVSGLLAITCLVTLIVGASMRVRTINCDIALLKNHFFTLGVLNAVAPFAFIYLLSPFMPIGVAG